MKQKWVLGDRIEYREVRLTQSVMDEEVRFGWEFLGPIVFPPGAKPSLDTFAAGIVHTSVDFARRHGLKGTIAPGTVFVGYISDMLGRELGIAWIERGKLSVRFVHMAGPGDTLYTSATLKAMDSRESGNRVIFNVLMVNQHGEPIVEGEAEAILT